MEKLLKWSAEAQGYDPNSGREIPKPDPKLMAELLGAPDEATQMKDALSAASNKEIDIPNRETALDNLEMLIENLDNANNLENMGMWPTLLELLDDESEVIRKMALWVTGTAVQNNDKAQQALVSKPGSISKLLDIAKHDTDKEVRLKAMYALNSALGHNKEVYDEFEKSSGWGKIKEIYDSADGDKKLQVKALSLIHSAVNIQPIHEKVSKVEDTELVDGMVIPVMEKSDISDLEEKALNLCSMLAEFEYKFSEQQINQIKAARSKIIEKSEGSLSTTDFPFFD